MPWAVTLQITDCSSTSRFLSYATINDGYTLWSADINGQFIAIVDDVWHTYIIDISKAGYLNKRFTLTREQHGTIQNICLNPASSSGSTGGGGGGW